MKISKAADLAGLSVKTVRYYSDIGLVKPSSRSNSGYRKYDQSKIQSLIFVRRAREFGFSIQQCRDLLNLYEDQDRSSAAVKRLANSRLLEIKKRQQELRLLHDELFNLIKTCKGDEHPDCPIISNLAMSP